MNKIKSFIHGFPIEFLIFFTLLGICLGLGIYTFVYAKGYSYISNDPKACLNCHIMRDQFEGWEKSSHHAVAVCNDCHTPHTGLLAKYWTKAENGFWHSFAFTTGKFVDPIRIKTRNRKIAEKACMNCHGTLFEQNPIEGTKKTEPHKSSLTCTHCHQSVGHP